MKKIQVQREKIRGRRRKRYGKEGKTIQKEGKRGEYKERTPGIPSHFSINPRQKGEVRGIMATRCGHYTCAFRFLRLPQKFGRDKRTVAGGHGIMFGRQ